MSAAFLYWCETHEAQIPYLTVETYPDDNGETRQVTVYEDEDQELCWRVIWGAEDLEIGTCRPDLRVSAKRWLASGVTGEPQ